MLTKLSILSGQRFVFPEPFEALRRVSVALITDASTVSWADERLTYFLRNAESVTDEDAAEARDHLVQQQDKFTNIINHAAHVRSQLRAEAGDFRSMSTAQYLDEVWWRNPAAFTPIISTMFETWGLAAPPPVEHLLAHDSWRLFLDGWGAEMYGRQIAHPPLRTVQAADFLQLIYLGAARNRVLASEDRGFQDLARSVLSGRYRLARMVPLAKLLE